MKLVLYWRWVYVFLWTNTLPTLALWNNEKVMMIFLKITNEWYLYFFLRFRLHHKASYFPFTVFKQDNTTICSFPLILLTISLRLNFQIFNPSPIRHLFLTTFTRLSSLFPASSTRFTFTEFNYGFCTSQITSSMDLSLAFYLPFYQSGTIFISLASHSHSSIFHSPFSSYFR